VGTDGFTAIPGWAFKRGGRDPERVVRGTTDERDPHGLGGGGVMR
jgi:hypothetical protein